MITNSIHLCSIVDIEIDDIYQDNIQHLEFISKKSRLKKPLLQIGLNLPSWDLSFVIYLSEQEKDVSISLAENSIAAGNDLHGTVIINYRGRFDSVVINSQIENSSDVFSYTNLNGKNIKHPYARLSIFKSELAGKNIINFTATTNHIPTGEYSNAKFRVSIIQEHKEVASDIAYTKIMKA